MNRWPVILLCLAGAAAAPPASPDKPAATKPVDDEQHRRIDRLLSDLNSADFKTRETATAGLIALGPDVLPALEKRLARTTTPEFRARAKQVTDGVAQVWRYWSPEGGPIAGGFQATLVPAAATTTFAAGAPILLKLEIRNVCPEPRQLVDVRGLDLDLGGEAGAITSAFGSGKLVIRAAAGGGPPAAEGRAIVFDTSEPRAIEFKTGGNIMVRVPLHDVLTLKPGEYEVRVTYYAKTQRLVKDAVADLESNSVKFKVE